MTDSFHIQYCILYTLYISLEITFYYAAPINENDRDPRRHEQVVKERKKEVEKRKVEKIDLRKITMLLRRLAVQ